MEQPSSEKGNLWKAVKGGDEKAFKQLYNKYWERLYKHAYKRLNSQVLSEELLQELFIQLWEKKETIDVKVSLEAYLYGNIKHRIMGLLREQYRVAYHMDHLKQNGSNQVNDSLELQIAQRDLLSKIERLIEQLPDRSRQVFQLSRTQYLTNREIAKQLEVSEKAVEYHINYALNFLKTNFPEYITMLVLLHSASTAMPIQV